MSSVTPQRGLEQSKCIQWFPGMEMGKEFTRKPTELLLAKSLKK